MKGHSLNIDSPHDRGCTPQLLAISPRNTAHGTVLIEAGADPLEQDSNYGNAFLGGVHHRCDRLIEVIIVETQDTTESDP